MNHLNLHTTAAVKVKCMYAAAGSRNISPLPTMFHFYRSAHIFSVAVFERSTSPRLSSIQFLISINIRYWQQSMQPAGLHLANFLRSY